MNYTLFLIFIIGCCCALSFLFSGMEAGVFALSRLRIRQQMRAGHSRSRALHGYLENTENFLWTILVGNTLVNFVAVSLVVAELYQGRWLQRQPVLLWLLLVGIIFLFYGLCDLLPKMLFRLYPTRLCLAVVPPFRLLHLVLSPLVSLTTRFANGLLQWTGGRKFTGHLFGSREELRQLMQESSHTLTSEERTMINRVLDLQNLTVRQIMVPLAQVISVNGEAKVTEMFNLWRQHQVSRLPVWQGQGKGRRIAGIVNLRTLLYSAELNHAMTAADYLRPALYLNEALRLEEALRLMQRSGHRLAIVLGPDLRELGIVSLEDILKVIFGKVSI